MQIHCVRALLIHARARFNDIINGQKCGFMASTRKAVMKVFTRQWCRLSRQVFLLSSRGRCVYKSCKDHLLYLYSASREHAASYIDCCGTLFEAVSSVLQLDIPQCYIRLGPSADDVTSWTWLHSRSACARRCRQAARVDVVQIAGAAARTNEKHVVFVN